MLSDLRRQLQAQLPTLRRAAVAASNLASAPHTSSLHMNDHLISYENAAFAFAQRANITLEHLQDVLYRSGEDILTTCDEIGKKVQLQLQLPITFCSVRERFAAEANKKEKKTEGNLHFGELIQKRIDSDRYPLLSKAFALDPDYCLDGTRRRVKEIVEGMERDADATIEEDGNGDAVLVVTRGNASVQRHIKRERWDNGGKERVGTSVRRIGRTRGIEKKQHMHPKAPRSKKERKSFRVLEHDVEEIRSEGSDSAIRSPIAPVRFQHIVELDQDDNPGETYGGAIGS